MKCTAVSLKSCVLLELIRMVSVWHYLYGGIGCCHFLV